MISSNSSRAVLGCAVNSRARCIRGRGLIQPISAAAQLYYGSRFSCYATAVKLAFGSPRDEEVLDGYVECDLLNNTSP